MTTASAEKLNSKNPADSVLVSALMSELLLSLTVAKSERDAALATGNTDALARLDGTFQSLDAAHTFMELMVPSLGRRSDLEQYVRQFEQSVQESRELAKRSVEEGKLLYVAHYLGLSAGWACARNVLMRRLGLVEVPQGTA